MNVLFLGPATDPVHAFLIKKERVVQTESPILDTPADVIVSRGYWHRVPSEVLRTTRAVNLHIGYLPWNRGVDPNLWSWIDGTPKGVTIHYMDEGFDTGPVLARQEVLMVPEDTLATSYRRLQDELTRLFVLWWPEIREGAVCALPQESGGSVHFRRDRPSLPQGWNTPVRHLANEDSAWGVFGK